MREIISDYMFQGQKVTALRIHFDYESSETYVAKDPSSQVSPIMEVLLDTEGYQKISHLIIGGWQGACEGGDSSQLIRDLVLYRDRLAHLESIFIGDMESEDCELSWINQTNYTPLLDNYPNLKSLKIKGTEGLSFDHLSHPHLRHFEIISGGLPQSVLDQLIHAQLPQLDSLRLYFGVQDYGFDGDIETIKPLLSRALFPNLKHLGLLNSEIQDDLVLALLESDILAGLTHVDLSMGTISDIGGQALLDHLPALLHLENIRIKYHYMSDDMVQKLENSGLNIAISDSQGVEEEGNDDFWCSPMFTE